jgi:hypothetical protein
MVGRRGFIINLQEIRAGRRSPSAEGRLGSPVVSVQRRERIMDIPFLEISQRLLLRDGMKDHRGLRRGDGG